MDCVLTLNPLPHPSVSHSHILLLLVYSTVPPPMYSQGIIRDGYCIESRTFYVGGTYAGLFELSEEHRAHLKHAVDLVNNKTDGWFDAEMPQVG
jgi:hypothetical protein